MHRVITYIVRNEVSVFKMTEDKREAGIKKACCFFAGEGHFLAMVLPYLARRIKNGARVIIFMDDGIKNKVPEFLGRLGMGFEYSDWQENVVQYPVSTVQKMDGKEFFARHLKSMVELLGMNCSDKGLIICIQKPKLEAEEITEKIRTFTSGMDIQVELVNCYEFTTDKQKALKIMSGHDSLLSGMGLSKINQVYPEIKIDAMV